MRYFPILLFCLYCPPAYVCAHSLEADAGQVSRTEDAFQKGLAALQDNRLEDALEDLNAAEREHPDDARVRNFRGILLVRMGRTAAAAAEYQESIRLDPLLEDAYRNLGFLRWTEHQLAPAREILERAVRLSPDDLFAHYYLGRVDLDVERYEYAFHELELSRQQWPGDAAFLIQVITGYISLGRKEDAHKSLEQLRKLPLSEAYSVQLVSLLLLLHDNDAAISLMQTLSGGNSPKQAKWVHFDLALVYLLAGSDDKAMVEAHRY